MRSSIGFVIVSHNLPDQTIRLSHRLTVMFGAPPIALHHDFGKCDLDRNALPANVHLMDPWIATGWGIFPVVEANLGALRLLYRIADPDWCISLSTADYPIKSAGHILSELKQTTYDGFIDYREVQWPKLPPGYQPDESKGFNDPGWLQLAYDRYVATRVYPCRLTWRFPLGIFVRGSLVERLLTPFSRTFRPYAGDHWYTLSRRAAKILAAEDELFTRLCKHYRSRSLPEESFYQTILCNRPDLRLNNDNMRFADWSAGGRHPKYLTASDIPILLSSRCHFARKFPNDPVFLDEIDRMVDSMAAKQP